MTGVTRVGGIDMIRIFTAGDRAVMTADASANDMGMIHVCREHRHPGYRTVMAGVAYIAGIYVVWAFTRRAGAIVTCTARLCSQHMIKVCWYPGRLRRCYMTVSTFQDSWNMIGPFSTGNDSVMTS